VLKLNSKNWRIWKNASISKIFKNSALYDS